jgi:hypothetical protein
VYVEQFLDVLGVGVDDWKAKPVREAVGPFRRLAAELELVLLASLHTNKSRTGTFRERVAGTQQFNALSRSSLLVAQHPEDEDRRVVARGKGNYSKRPPALEFAISSTTLDINGYRLDIGLVDGITESELTVDQILGQPREGLTKADHGRRLIADELGDGEWHKAPRCSPCSPTPRSPTGRRDGSRPTWASSAASPPDSRHTQSGASRAGGCRFTSLATLASVGLAGKTPHRLHRPRR